MHMVGPGKQIGPSPLIANGLWWLPTELTFATRQVAHAIDQSNEMSVDGL